MWGQEERGVEAEETLRAYRRGTGKSRRTSERRRRRGKRRWRKKKRKRGRKKRKNREKREGEEREWEREGEGGKGGRIADLEDDKSPSSAFIPQRCNATQRNATYSNKVECVLRIVA